MLATSATRRAGAAEQIPDLFLTASRKPLARLIRTSGLARARQRVSHELLSINIGWSSADRAASTATIVT